MSTREDRVRARRLLLAVKYTGPWERLEGFFFGVRPDPDQPLRWEIPQDPRGWRRVMGWLGSFCSRRDAAWRSRHAVRGTWPRDIWRRKDHATG